MPFWDSSIAAGVGRRVRTRRPTIIVADDDRDIRELYRACFDMSGFRTAEASTGEEAIRTARRLVPDVLLTDFMLPDFDGLTVARRLKQDAATAAVRIILLTGFGLENFQRQAADAGVFRALLKPCLPEVMLREVKRVIAAAPPPG